MTRVNVVPPAELCGKHLVAEYREIPRLYGLVSAAIIRNEKPDDKRNPLAYTLGTGHCRFFYTRLGFILNRQFEIYNEMLARDYRPQYAPDPALLLAFDPCWTNDYIPDELALKINRQRIADRMPKR